MKRPDDSDRLQAHSRLMAALQAATERGERIPCIGDPETWDGEHPELRDAARFGCQVCDQLTACRAYVTAHPEPGECIWAGLNAREQKRLHRKESAA